jgi:hypothetical protein
VNPGVDHHTNPRCQRFPVGEWLNSPVMALATAPCSRPREPRAPRAPPAAGVAAGPKRRLGRPFPPRGGETSWSPVRGRCARPRPRGDARSTALRCPAVMPPTTPYCSAPGNSNASARHALTTGQLAHTASARRSQTCSDLPAGLSAGPKNTSGSTSQHAGCCPVTCWRGVRRSMPITAHHRLPRYGQRLASRSKSSPHLMCPVSPLARPGW